MATLRISLPADLQAYVDRQVASGSYADADALISDLIRERAIGQASTHNDELASLLEKGLASGVSELTAAQVFAEARAKFHSRHD